jgi:CubicO group peptidase (beta-lactamase class C family)
MRFGLSRSFWFLLIAIALTAAATLAMPHVNSVTQLGSGFMAHTLCSGVLVSERRVESVMEDLSGPGLEALRWFTTHVDRKNRSASAALFGLAAQTSIHREGFGCTLIHDRDPEALQAETAGLLPMAPPPHENAEWPQGARVTPGPWPDDVKADAAERAIADIFTDADTKQALGTRALVVVHRGRIVAERYADGFDAQMPMIGWSMSKTATNALIGLRVKDGALNLDDDRLMPQWWHPDDPRGTITLDELMRMTSGLAFDESHDDELSDVSQMLFVQAGTAAFAASKPLLHDPGTVWSYSSGTSNILAGILRQTFNDERAYLRYPHARLFGPLGMRSAELAPDASGTFMGSSFLYASPRDWARLGLLFLQDGVWVGERLLPEGWAAYSLRPTPQSPEDEYGAQVWLKLPNAPGRGEPPMPEDAFYMLGYNGQAVVMVPSRALVVVRLGLSPRGSGWDPLDLAPLVNAFPSPD